MSIKQRKMLDFGFEPMPKAVKVDSSATGDVEEEFLYNAGIAGSPVEEKKEESSPSDGSLRDEILTAIRGLRDSTPVYGGSEHDRRGEEILEAVRGSTYEDFTKGDAYEALVARYGDGGRRAMKDTLGQLSARTGGLASSFAGTVAQQSYNDYMAELEAVARGEYEKERQTKIDDAKLSLDLGARDYDRWQDERNRERSDSLSAIEALYKMLGYDMDAEQFAYKKEQDALDRKEAALAREQAEQALMKNEPSSLSYSNDKDAARGAILEILQGGGELSDISYDLIARSGFSPEDLLEWSSLYEAYRGIKKNVLEDDVSVKGSPLRDIEDTTDEYNEKVRSLEAEKKKEAPPSQSEEPSAEQKSAKTESPSPKAPSQNDVNSVLREMQQNGATKKEINHAITSAYKDGIISLELLQELRRRYA